VTASDDRALPTPWLGLHEAIAAAAGCWAIDDCMIFNFGEHHLQLIQNLHTVHIEITDMDPRNPWLDLEQRGLLAADGWEPPDPPGYFAWRLEVPYQPGPQHCQQIAMIVCDGLYRICRVQSPEELAIRAFSTNTGEDLAVALRPLELQRARADADVRHTTVRLTEAAITHALAVQFPDGVTVAARSHHAPDVRSSGGVGSAGANRWPGGDLLLYLDGPAPRLMVWHVIPADGRSVVMMVLDPNRTDGSFINVEQGSAPYLRELLERNLHVREAMARDPAMHRNLSEVLATRGLEGISCQGLAIGPDGSMTLTDYRIDPSSLGPAPLRLALPV
jgi:hypothetical protein